MKKLSLLLLLILITGLCGCAVKQTRYIGCCPYSQPAPYYYLP